MQITPVPLPPQPAAATSPQAVAQVLPQNQSQAVKPYITRAVDPSPKAHNKQKARGLADKAKGGESDSAGKRGGKVNISV